VSAVTDAFPRPATDENTPATPPSPGRPLLTAGATVGLAALLVAIAFTTGGGVDEIVASSGNTWTEIVLTLLGLVAVTIGLFLRPPGARRFGWATAGLMGVMFALEAASIAWSVAPDSSWLASGQMLAYLMVFAGAIFLARPLMTMWSVVLGALVLWAGALCAWSLLAEVFPASLAADDQFGRLQAPFGYWNAIALCAAMGVPCCLWLGARNDGGRRLAALAAPALALLISVLVLSYSRSADLAAVVAGGLWLVFVPLRLRAVAITAVGALGGAVISVWALAHHSLSSGTVTAHQDHAGHILGIVVIVVLALSAIAGIAITEAMDRTRISPQTRARIGAGLLALVGAAVVVAVLGVAASHRGLTGEISHRWHQLTNPAAVTSAGNASRVFQFGSSRPIYWHEALFVGNSHYYKGVGELGFSVARLLDPTSVAPVAQAHSYVFETYADLGILGLVVTAALLGSWLLASGRALAPRRRRRTLSGAATAERVGLITLAALVVAFGVQGTLDWTWYFAGLTVPALLAAGWLAGRGPQPAAADLDTPAVVGAVGPVGAVVTRRRASPLDRPGALAVAAVLVVAVVLGCWLVWRPLHSAQLVNAAVDTGDVAAARSAHAADPFALGPYEVLSAAAQSDHDPGLARAELVRATREQPRNPLVWEALAQLLVSEHAYKAAIPALHEVQVLDVAVNQMTLINNQLIRKALPSHPPTRSAHRAGHQHSAG
jgi:hypothetical protein